jgi:hypothetical protein
MWRALSGTATAYLWIPVMTVTSFSLFGTTLAMAYVVVSWLGLRSLYRWKKLSVAVWNTMKMSPARSQQLLALHETIVSEAKARFAGARNK